MPTPTLQRPRTRVCGTCGAGWTDRHARYCGMCGVPLRTDTVGAPRVRSSSRPRLVAAVLAVSLVGGVAATWTTGALDEVLDGLRDRLPAGGWWLASSDPEVALPPPDEPAPPLREVDPDQAADLRRAVDPRRVRCEPRGCEVWRYNDAHRMTFADAGQGRLAFFGGGELVVLDAAMGLEVLRVDLGELLADVPAAPGEAHGTDPVLDGSVQVKLLPGGVVVAARTSIARLDDDGALVWRRRTTSGDPYGLFLDGDGDRLVVERGTRSGNAQFLLDPQDGRVLWEGRSGYVVGISDHVLLSLEEHVIDPPGAAADRSPRVPGRQLTGVSTEDGRLLWERQLTGGWPMVFGELAVLPGASSPDGTSADTLVDIATGEERVTLPGAVATATQYSTSGLLVVVGDPAVLGPWRWFDASPEPTGEATPLTVVAYELDGTLRWSLPLADTMVDGCCVDLLPGPPGTVEVRVFGPSTTSLLVDHATGAVVDDVRDPERSQDGHTWLSQDGLATLHWRNDELRYTTAEGSVRILGQDTWLVSESPPVVFGGDELVGVRPVPGG